MTSTRPRLRALREERGWTQQEVAEQVSRLAWLRRRERVGVNADMVAKWERGEKKPSPRYRKLLCLLFGADADSLGFGSAGAVRAEGATRAEADDASLITMLSEAASLLDQFGAAGAILQPPMLDVRKDELMKRRALIKLMGLAASARLTVPGESGMASSGRLTSESAQDLDQLATKYQALYHSTAPAVLMAPVIAHLGRLRDLISEAGPAALRRRLFANRARVSTLAGRLAFFDLRDPIAARGYFNLAMESAHEAGDHLQAAAALGHLAFVPAADHVFGVALDYLRAAERQAGRNPDRRVSSWLYAVESEIQTDARSHDAALAAVDRAQEALAAPGPTANLPWFDYYDAIRLSGFAGYALLKAGQLDGARSALTDAAAQLPQAAVKQRSVLLADIATVELASGDLEQACATAGDAAEQLRLAGYATGFGRLWEFRTAAQHWNDSLPVKALDDRLAELR